MKVYVVLVNELHEGSSIAAVFASKQGAQEYISTHPDTRIFWHGYEEWEVNE